MLPGVTVSDSLFKPIPGSVCISSDPAAYSAVTPLLVISPVSARSSLFLTFFVFPVLSPAATFSASYAALSFFNASAASDVSEALAVSDAFAAFSNSVKSVVFATPVSLAPCASCAACTASTVLTPCAASTGLTACTACAPGTTCVACAACTASIVLTPCVASTGLTACTACAPDTTCVTCAASVASFSASRLPSAIPASALSDTWAFKLLSFPISLLSASLSANRLTGAAALLISFIADALTSLEPTLI